jgi:hypothetical protein
MNNIEGEKAVLLSDILINRKFDPNIEIEPEQIIFKIGGKKIGSLQNLVTISGKQKGGKTRFMSAGIAAALSGKSIFEIEIHLPVNRNKVCLFDTEQGSYDFAKTIKQIKKFSGTISNLDAYNVREDEPALILQLIDEYLKNNPECSLIIIDGLLDLLIDFNNVYESKQLINFIKKITKIYNVLLIAIIHRGKGNDTTIGNIGSMADRLAQSVLKVEKNKEKNTFILSSEFLRSDEDFSPIEIFNAGGHWEQTFHEPEQDKPFNRSVKAQPQDYDLFFHKNKILEIFESKDTVLKYEDLIQLIKEVYTNGRNWAVDCLKYLKEQNLIFRTKEGYTVHSQTKIFS